MSSTQTLLDLPSTFRSLFWPVAIILALLLGLLWLMGYGPGGSTCRALGMASVPAAVPAPAPTAPAAPSAVNVPVPAAVQAAAPAAAPATAAPPAVKFLFDTSKTDVKNADKVAAAAVVAYLKAHPSAKAMLAGYHDPRGDKAGNEALALNRARAVRAFLEEQGIARDRIDMSKPAETTGDGSLENARRVELTVQP